MKPETDEEWADYLRTQVSTVTGDTEAAHGTADWVLIEFLKSKGYLKLIEAWEAVDKWYA